MYKNAIETISQHYGYDAQSRQLIEEMAELTQAINKYWRKQLECGKRTPFETYSFNEEWKNIVEEIADVEICLSQLKFLLGIRPYEIEQIIEQKLNRQLERIGADERK